MPVRKIPKNYLSVTGSFSSRKNGRSLGYESLLERDLMILLEFDDDVEAFEEQPVNIPFKVDGKSRKPYVPDILICYKSSQADVPGRKVLGEVKNSGDLQKNKAKYAPKFDAAKCFAQERGWEWRLFTEKYIRTPYLNNLKFLREYLDSEPSAILKTEVLDFVTQANGKATVGKVFETLCPTDERTLSVAPALWHLLITKILYANLKKQLDENTRLSLNK